MASQLITSRVNNICNKVSQKLNALTRIANYINPAQRRVIMKAFIISQFGYCPLVWTFHSRGINNRINRLHERALRLAHNDYDTSFQDLLIKDKYVTIHQRNLQVFAILLYIIINNEAPEIVRKIFYSYYQPHYNLSQNFEFQIVNIRTVRYGTKSLTHLANKIWSIIPTEAKNAHVLESFEQQIKLSQTTNCPCGLCKTYVQQIGFMLNKF